MFSYRITKYNPNLRDNKGIYTDTEEWTSFSDIGKTIHGKLFTLESYLEVENKYIDTVIYFMEKMDIETLTIKDLEIYTESKLPEGIKDNVLVDKNLIRNIITLILREDIWAKLECNKELQIHFGYDYYMYIISSEKNLEVIKKIRELGLYVENYHSPYV